MYEPDAGGGLVNGSLLSTSGSMVVSPNRLPKVTPPGGRLSNSGFGRLQFPTSLRSHSCKKNSNQVERATLILTY